jgi:2-oxoisovalerate dehydrogenase E1 component
MATSQAQTGKGGSTAKKKTSKKKASAKKGKLPGALTTERLVEAYTLARTSRLLDDKMLRMLKQGKSFFHIGCMGHEAVQVATAFALERGRDWAYPYYRGQSLCLGWG